MNNHTPGPWHAKYGRQAWRVSDADNAMLAVLVDGVEADAFLMAGAPELLEACRRLLTFNEDLCADVGVSKHYPSAEFARAAIARATGEPTP